MEFDKDAYFVNTRKLNWAYEKREKVLSGIYFGGERKTQSL